MKKTLLSLLVVASMLLSMTTMVMGGSSADVTVTAAPGLVSFNSSPNTWTMNGLTGSGLVDENTTYYSNPLGDTTPPSATVADGECYFTWNNTSSVNISVSVNCIAFTGGGADMANSNTGSNNATHYGGYSWVSGQTYATDKQIIKSSGSTVVFNTTSAGQDKKWGAEITTRTNTWTNSTASTATMTISAAAL